jgi:hypothetical protein
MKMARNGVASVAFVTGPAAAGEARGEAVMHVGRCCFACREMTIKCHP